MRSEGVYLLRLLFFWSEGLCCVRVLLAPFQGPFSLKIANDGGRKRYIVISLGASKGRTTHMTAKTFQLTTAAMAVLSPNTRTDDV